ncbi:MAG: hypothetical protein KAR40_17930 [Candidatus Sabulitectum sp.]|nr:hypothetical protein [Candidatus Sabulitectum sp.]
MILLAVALGNHEEAFIENRFADGLNIIYSNDNNKGKTILIQSIMFSIGNVPIFPTSLEYKRYHFYSKFRHNKRILEFLRSGNSILVREHGLVSLFDSITDFKIFFNEEIFRLPRFVKDGRPTMADLSLFFQTFFLPQDKRNTSTIINGGRFNKSDFNSMIKALINPNYSNLDSLELDVLKTRRKEIIKQIAVLSRRLSFARENPAVARQVLQSVNNVDFQEQSNALQKTNKEISANSTKRNRATNRRCKLQNLVSQLNSLNRSIKIGKVKCADCGSEKIVYSNGEFTFEVSNDIVRREIISSIHAQISNISVAISEYSNEISRLQLELQSRLAAIPAEVTDIIISREAVLNERDNDQKIVELTNEQQLIEQQLAQQELLEGQSIQNTNKRIAEIVDEMKSYYADIDEVENSSIEGLFTKHNENFSGSEEQIFYFSKLVSISKHLKIPFPIIVDCFRDGELSTYKELKMIKEYQGLNKQVILTSTLKTQEYSADKYPSSEQQNAINYSSILSNKLLQSSFCSNFDKILASFNIEVQKSNN